MSDNKRPPTHRLSLCTRPKDGRRYADLGALYMGDERPSAMLARPYKDSVYVVAFKLSDGTVWKAEDLYLNVNATKKREPAPVEDFGADPFGGDDSEPPF